MPTKRRKRSRNPRGGGVASVIEDYIHGRATKDDLVQINPFLIFFGRNTCYGEVAYEIWLRDGEKLLSQAGYQGRVQIPGTCIVGYGDLAENLVTMVHAYGEPWED